MWLLVVLVVGLVRFGLRLLGWLVWRMLGEFSVVGRWGLLVRLGLRLGWSEDAVGVV